MLMSPDSESDEPAPRVSAPSLQQAYHLPPLVNIKKNILVVHIGSSMLVMHEELQGQPCNVHGSKRGIT